MSSWVKCTAFGEPECAVFVNLDMVVSLTRQGNATTINYAADAGPDAGTFLVTQTPEEILDNEPIRNA